MKYLIVINQTCNLNINSQVIQFWTNKKKDIGQPNE